MGFVEDYFSMGGGGGSDGTASNEGATHLLLGGLVPNQGVGKVKSVSRSVVSDSLGPHGL